MKSDRIKIMQQVADGDLSPEQADRQLLKLFNDREFLVKKLMKVDKIARSISGYRTGFGLPLDNSDRIERHKAEINKMVNAIKSV
jgi:GTP-binding protein EngB required for normal cell division